MKDGDWFYFKFKPLFESEYNFTLYRKDVISIQYEPNFVYFTLNNKPRCKSILTIITDSHKKFLFFFKKRNKIVIKVDGSDNERLTKLYIDLYNWWKKEENE